jgi:hypothetical protein
MASKSNSILEALFVIYFRSGGKINLQVDAQNITELDDYRICKKFLKTRHITSHPANKNIKKFETQNNPEEKFSLESFVMENVLGKSIQLFQYIITALQSS